MPEITEGDRIRGHLGLALEGVGKALEAIDLLLACHPAARTRRSADIKILLERAKAKIAKEAATHA